MVEEQAQSPKQIEQMFSTSLQAHQAGRLAEAIDGYQRILAQQPEHVAALLNLANALRALLKSGQIPAEQQAQIVQQVCDYYQKVLSIDKENALACYNLGNVHADIGQAAEAIEYYQRAVQLKPDLAPAFYNLGNLLRDSGRLEDAVVAYRQALEQDKESTRSYINLGNVLKNLGQHTEAIAMHEQALERQPNEASNHYNLASALFAAGKEAKGEAALAHALNLDNHFIPALFLAAERARATGDYAQASDKLGHVLMLQPDNVTALMLQAECFYHQNRCDDALPLVQQAIQKMPNSARAHDLLGIIQQALGHFQESIACFNKAVSLKPNNAQSYSNLGAVLQKIGQHEPALQALQKAVELNPNLAIAYANMGFSYYQLGQIGEALASGEKALALEPDSDIARLNHGLALVSHGDLDMAVAEFKKTFELNPDCNKARSNYVYTISYSDTRTPQEICQAHCEWGEYWSQRIDAATQWAASEHEGKPLRIGYISPDFRRHPAGFLFSSFFKHHTDAVQTYCYAYLPAADDLSEQLKQQAHSWCDITGMTDDQVAAKIQQDEIDILVDLAGHTANNRLLVLARKPAPIQASYLGYPNTTGLQTVDYLIADKYVCPKSAERYYTESVVKLPRYVFCYTPHEFAPEVAPAPHLKNAYITFGCYNNLPKLTPTVLAAWAQILQAVPDARLRLKSRPFEDESTCEHYRQMFVDLGIDNTRIDFSGPSVLPEMLAECAEVDIFLDPFPFNGGVTTLDTTWMGAPTITLQGDVFSHRMGTSMLTHLGCKELIAKSQKAYVKLAVKLAKDSKRLQEYRETLRQRMAESSLCDGVQHAKDLEALYQKMWQEG